MDLLRQLWDDYARINPQAGRIHALLEARGERIVNDHIAFRTFDDPRVEIDVLARPFISAGYEPRGEYQFPEKKLHARHCEHADESLPKVFISELKLNEFSPTLRRIIGGLLDQMPADAPTRADFPAIGRPWGVSFADYERLRAESEYAAWLAAFGFRANHFTVSVNHLRAFDSLQQLNAFLKDSGFELNTAGGEVKGSPEDRLEQSATLAGEARVEFSDAAHAIPGCYYEFARRYPMADGKLFTGFVPASADKIFHSTDRRGTRG